VTTIATRQKIHDYLNTGGFRVHPPQGARASHARRRLHLLSAGRFGGLCRTDLRSPRQKPRARERFIDVDNIPPGRDFVEVLSERSEGATRFVLIGKTWLASADKDTRRRLDDPHDFDQ
jgi:hypothetical protein